MVSGGAVGCSLYAFRCRLGFDEKKKQMDIEAVKEIIRQGDGLSNTLGMEFLSTPEPDIVRARMEVNDRNKQPFGFLSGGSMALCPGKVCVGISVSGNHVKAMAYGGVVQATAHLQHKGRTLHVWHIDITNEEGDLISTVQVSNYIITPRKNG